MIDEASASAVIVKDALMSLPPDYIKSEIVCNDLQSQFSIKSKTAREIAKRLLKLSKTISTKENALINSELQEIYDLVQENPDVQDFLEKWICDNSDLK
ncbi:hypothetical protein DSO57_1009203 [Entomophthora muscae]|uniref:Uncharacterized protein n=1 Tax=Entomophthora muscae TaxID=34485 RepID=A0ACC2SVV1_9FUNG|nr:hypothetical protein DSO57_1009203 [Entomophthora muscae]